MKLLTLNLTAKEPLIITSGSSEGMAHSCLDYIPGSMILGAFAAVWKRLHPDTNPDDSESFRKLFLSDAVSWGNAVPLCAGKPTLPVPLCLMAEKNMPGLPMENAEIQSARIVAFNTLAFSDDENDDNLSGEYKRIFAAKDDPDAPPPKFKRISAIFMEPESCRQPDIHKIWRTRVALGKDRAAQNGLLYGFFAIAPETRFQAKIYCQDNLEPEIKELLKNLDSIHVGHARSSGCGKTEIAHAWSDAPQPQIKRQKEFTLLLASHYLPSPPWEDALQNFMQNLEERYGIASANISQQIVAHMRLEGFNFHWRAWRNSRPGLAQGSVFKIRLTDPIEMPETFCLGSDQHEGYGRIIVNLPMLDKKCLEAKASGKISEQDSNPASPPVNLLQNPVWKLLRKRAASRLAQKLAQLWLVDKYWLAFLDDAEKLDKPTANQRMNVLNLNYDKFKKMLDKTPGEQWKHALCKNPFAHAKKDALSNIMLTLLNRDEFCKWAKEKQPPAQGKATEICFVLPGDEQNSPTLEQNRHQIITLAYEFFKRDLIRAWNKLARIRQQTSAAANKE